MLEFRLETFERNCWWFWFQDVAFNASFSRRYNSKKDCIRGIHRFCKRVGIKRYTIKEG